MILRVDHIDLKTAHFNQTIQLFQTMGLKILREMPERGSVEMVLPGENQVVFEIRKMGPNEHEGIHHIAFQSDAAEDVALIKEKGEVTFLSERTLVKQTGRTVSTFTDINGLVWQLTD